MAWTGPIENVEFSSAVSATTYTWSPAANIAVGTLIILIVAQETNQGVQTCADNSSQAGPPNQYRSTVNTAGTGIRGWTYICTVTRQIQTTDVITLTLAGAATRRSGRLITFTGNDTYSPLQKTATINSLVASPVSAPSGVSLAANMLGMMVSFWAGGAVLGGMTETLAGWTASACAVGSGGATNRVEANFSYKTTFGTASESPSHSYTSFTTGCGCFISFLQPGIVGPVTPKVVTRRTEAGG